MSAMTELRKGPRSGTAKAAGMDARIPLATLLAQALVAYTIEFDNAAEERLAHWTTAQGRAAGGPQATWLVSMAMWFNCMRWLPEDGLTLRELERRARTPTNLHGMQRWGYVRMAPPAAGWTTDLRVKVPKRDWLVRPTARGRRAQAIWPPLFGVIEDRWRERFGGLEVDALQETLGAIAAELDPGLPDCLPILGYGLLCAAPDPKLGPPPMVDQAASDVGVTLPALLARVLLAFALEFERESPMSLALCANVLRVLDEEPVKLRDVPMRSGVSKESISMAMGILKKFKLAMVGKEGNWQVVWLTALGMAARESFGDGIARLEGRWKERFGERWARARDLLEPIVGDGTAEGSLLFQGLEPPPKGWRAMVKKPQTLPHFPMVLHRGGYPDGA